MPKLTLTRREMLQLSATAATALTLPAFAEAAQPSPQENLYAQLLQTWCDGLLIHQSTNPDPALRGALLCPACAIIHGRCGDAVYPLLRQAHATGQSKYLEAALLVHEWSEQQVSRADGSWINDVTLSSWQGITVFHAIPLAEALPHHGPPPHSPKPPTPTAPSSTPPRASAGPTVSPAPQSSSTPSSPSKPATSTTP